MKKNNLYILSGIVYIILTYQCLAGVPQEYSTVVDEYFLALKSSDIEKYASLNSPERLNVMRSIGATVEEALNIERKYLPRLVSMKVRKDVKFGLVIVEVRGVVGDGFVPKGIVRANESNYVGIFELKIKTNEGVKDIRVQNYSFGVSFFKTEDPN